MMNRIKIFFILSLMSAVFSANTLSVSAQTDTNLEGANRIQTIDDGYGFNVDFSGDYLFDFDQDELSASAKNALTKVLAIYVEYEGFQIEISGHTDSQGSDRYNQVLSERRANRVYRWFLDQGVAETSLSQTGYGETQPVAKNQVDGEDNPQGRALNRRVEIRAKTRQKVTVLPTAIPVKPIAPSAPLIPSKQNISKPIVPSKPKIPKPIAPLKPQAPSRS